MPGAFANVWHAVKSAELFLPVDPCGEGLIISAHAVIFRFAPVVGMPTLIVVSPANDYVLRFYQSKRRIGGSTVWEKDSLSAAAFDAVTARRKGT